MDPNIIALIIAIAGAAGSIISFIVGRREKAAVTDAQTSAHISAAYKDLVDGLQERVIALEKTYEENETLKAENKELREQVRRLTEENKKLAERVKKLELELDKVTKKMNGQEN